MSNSGDEINDQYYYETSSSPVWSSESILKTLDVAFRNQLKSSDPKAPQPPQIKVPLRDHQKALIYAMGEREKASQDGYTVGNMTAYSNYGVLGDEVGSGKSLVALSYIAHRKNNPNLLTKRRVLLPNSRPCFFSVYTKEYKDASSSSLIIVPHNIFRQWQEYCKSQTSLNVLLIKNIKDISPLTKIDESSLEAKTDLILKLKTSDAVLVSNTLYGELQYWIDQVNNEQKEKEKHILWQRIFVDEVDTINITGTSRKLNAPFVWFISATWPNFIMDGCVVRATLLNHYNSNKDQYSPALGEWLKSEIGTDVQPISTSPSSYYANYYSGRVTWLRTKSRRFLDQYSSSHTLRAMVLLNCSKEFLNESRQMPQLIETTILCEQPATHRVLNGIVSAQIQNMLHAGNVEGALQELGVQSDTTVNLIEAVRSEREKELSRLKKTLAFKESIDYATPQAKEAALLSLKNKIQSVESQLKAFESRMTEEITEECPICYDDPKQISAVVTPCCHRIFCGSCILQSLTRVMTCPMCRTSITTRQLIQVVKDKKDKKINKEEKKLLSKPKQLIKFLKENPEARVLVFSRYENPFNSLEADCESEGISHHTLRGNKDVVASIIKSFEKGEKRALFLPTETMGAGLNLVGATHIILLHAMTPEEEKQAIGRAYRLGRSSPLHVIRLLHDLETLSA
jgi:SNF2 family DNA or RNA helicase